jgi:hypothetical protein
MLDLTGQVDLAFAETAYTYTAAKTCRTPNETWIAKGNYRQHLHQKEIAALPASVQSLNARPFKNKQIQDKIGRKSRKIDKYQQIGQSLGSPAFVEAVQTRTPEMRQSIRSSWGPSSYNPYARPSCPSAPLLAATPSPRSPHPLRPNRKQKQSMSTTLILTNPPMPKQHTLRSSSYLGRPAPLTRVPPHTPPPMQPHGRMKKQDPHSTFSAMAHTVCVPRHLNCS